MSRIIYEDEFIKEEIDKGIVPLNNRSSVTGKIISVLEAVNEDLRRRGIDVDSDDITIDFGSASDVIDNDEDKDIYDDDQVVSYHVYRNVPQKVAYKVEEELVYNGHFTEFEDRLSQEEKEKLALEYARDAHKIDGDDSLYNVDIYGADDDGYDNPVTGFNVYKITSKEKVDETEKTPEKQDNNISKEELSRYLEEFKDIRSRLESVDSVEERSKLIEELVEKEASLRNIMSNSSSKEIDDGFKKELDELDNSIKDIQDNIKENIKKYDSIYDELKNIIDEQNNKMNSETILSNEELDSILEEYGNKKLEINEKSIKIKNDLDNQNKLLSTLKRRKNALKRDIAKAEALDISYAEYKDITSTLRKKNVLNSILERKGLSEIIDKPYKERTKEEKNTLKEAKEEIEREIAALKNENSELSIMDAIEVLYSLSSQYTAVEEPKMLSVSLEKIDNIKENSELLPARVVGGYSKNNEPLKAPSDLVDEALDIVEDYELKKVMELEFDSSSMNKEAEFKRVMGFDFDPDKYTITTDEGVMNKDGQLVEQMIIYEKVPVNELEDKLEDQEKYSYKRIKAFNIDPSSMKDEEEFKRIMGFDFDPDKYEIRPDDGVRDSEDEDDYNGGEYDDGVYERHVIYEKVPVIDNDVTPDNEEDDDKEVEEDKPVEEKDDSPEYDDSDVVERIKLFRDAETGEIFIRKAALTRFKDYIGEKTDDDLVKIDGARCYRISDDDVQYIETLANNQFSPYRVEYVDIGLDNNITKPEPQPEPEPEPSRTIPEPQPEPEPEPSRTIPEPQPEPEPEPSRTIPEPQPQPEPRPTPTPGPQPIPQPEQTRRYTPTVQEILRKVTKDVGRVKYKDDRRYLARNISVSKNLLSELRTGQVDYNIVAVAKSVGKAIGSLLTKVTSRLFLSKAGKRACAEIEKNLDELSEEELEVLWTKYRGSVMLADMNYRINNLINARLKRYAMEKMQGYNSIIKGNYTKYFALLKEMDKVEANSTMSEVEKENARNALMKAAADCVRTIHDVRIEGNTFMHGGAHGFEEDIKAVNSFMNYEGRHHVKKHNFDHELQAEKAEKEIAYEHALEDNDDDEKIVNTFLDFERVYYDNSKVKRGLFGKKSVGKTYYSPLIEDFDYRPDPFLTDLITTVVIATSAISTINSIKVNVANAKAVRAHNQQLDKVNQANDAAISQAHQIGDNINAQGDKFVEGAKAGAYHDVLNDANISERATLDQTVWSFNDLYYKLDHANHARFNGLYSDTVSKINDISSKYASGSIDQVTALQQLSSVQANTQGSLNGVISDCMDICTKYAAEHPQHDLTAITGTMEYIMANPNAITQMTQAGVTTLEEAAKLAGLSSTQAYAFTGLDSDLLTTLLGCGSALALANRVIGTMETNVKAGKYDVKQDKKDIQSMFAENISEEESNVRTR